jgi:hypothetical protein
MLVVPPRSEIRHHPVETDEAVVEAADRVLGDHFSRHGHREAECNR